MLTRITTNAATILLILFVLALSGCSTVSQDTGASQKAVAQPTIDASPVQQGEGQWKLATSDTVTLTVAAPGAKSARILYRPIVETDRHVVLKNVNTPTDSRGGVFSSSLKLVADFAGDVWAEVSYPDGTKKET